MTSSGRGLLRMDIAIQSAAAAKFPCLNDRLACLQCLIYGDYLRSSLRHTTFPECGSSLEVRSRYVDYLAERFYRAIGYGRLELRNAHGFVVYPPDHSVLKEPTLLQQLKTWFETTYIRLGDYERFCVDEDIPDALADRREVCDVWSFRSQGEDAIAEEPETAVASNVAHGGDIKEALSGKLEAIPAATTAQKQETVVTSNANDCGQASLKSKSELGDANQREISQLPSVFDKSIEKLSADSVLPDIPGKIPRNGSGMYAVKAAWEIECETKCLASSRQVIGRLKEWADGPLKGELLTVKDENAVIWHTRVVGKKKKFDQEACHKALLTWNKSRNPPETNGN